MKLFEGTFREGYEFFERVYCTDLKKSLKRKIDLPHEWYEPSSRGLYTSLLDSNIRLDKKQGRAADGRDQYGFNDPMYRNIRDNYWADGKFNEKPRIWYLDIETRSGTVSRGFPKPELALEPVSMIQIFDSELDQVIMIGLREWKHIEDYRDKMEYPCKYIVANDEIHLFEIFLGLFKKMDPLIIYAWHGAGFDFPYLHNRMKNLGLDPNRLSNHSEVSYSESEFQGQKEFKFSADGHFYLDIMDVYKKFVLDTRPNYKLDTIAEIDLKENKVSHSEYTRFDDFYQGNYNIPENPTEDQKNSRIYQEAIKNGITEEVKELGHSEFCWYSYKDPLLIKKIDDIKSLTGLMVSISKKMGVQISDTLGTVKPWSKYISNIALEDMKVLPPRQEFDDPHVVGGYVRDPKSGKHEWIIGVDVNSMYPLLGMVAFNMSPETYLTPAQLPSDLRDVILAYFNNQDESLRLELPDEVWELTVELLNKYNYCLGINGAVFSKESIGIVPRLVHEIYIGRKELKAKQHEYDERSILISKNIQEKSK